jgi:autotransporter-associated beta strand protein
LTLTGGAVSVSGGAGTVVLSEYGGSATLNLGNGSSAGTLSAAIVTGSSSAAVVNFDQNGLYSFAPSLEGSLSVNAIGAGATTLSSGSSSYTGATTVTAGTLIVTGSLTGTVSTSVTAGATLEVDGSLNTSATNTVTGTLQGTGSVGAITAHGGVIAPGLTTANAATATGILTANGAVTLSSTTSFNIRLGLSLSGTDCDQLLVNSGNINLAGANLQLNLDMAHIAPPASGIPTFYAIIIGGASLTGSNSDVFGACNGAAIMNNSFRTSGGLVFNILYAANANGSDIGSGHDVVLEEEAIPEPRTLGLVLSAAGLFLQYRRRI